MAASVTQQTVYTHTPDGTKIHDSEHAYVTGMYVLTQQTLITAFR